MNLKSDHFNQHFSRLKWAARRGMLELDVLLNNFLDHAYLKLSLREQAQFVQLLNQSDPDLFAWLIGQAMPEDPALAEIVNKVRAQRVKRV